MTSSGLSVRTLVCVWSICT